MNWREVYRQPTITERSFVMPFGKHKNKTIGELLDIDPWYISWLAENTDMDFDHDILREANGERNRIDAEFEAFVEANVLAD